MRSLLPFLAFLYPFLLLSPVHCDNDDATTAPPYVEWLSRFGHDDFTYPHFLLEEMADCACARATSADDPPRCRSRIMDNKVVDWRDAVAASREESGSDDLTFCVSKAWLLEHMPAFDLQYLPPSVSVNVTSMLDDVAAFAVLADRLATFKVPLLQKLRYVLPYASYHEARTNWRPLLFAKHIAFAYGAPSTAAALATLVAPNVFLNWSSNTWQGAPNEASAASGGSNAAYEIEWESSTAPPVVGPFEFASYGFASCSGWSSMVVYLARSVGVPARQVGTPCWDGGDFRGPASENANVTKCWAGGDGATQGGSWLYNHNWVEFWDDAAASWAFLNVPPQTSAPDEGLSGCAAADFPAHGCGWNGTAATAGASAAHGSGGGGGYTGDDEGCAAALAKGAAPASASVDHEILAATWTLASDDEMDVGMEVDLEGGPLVDAANYTLSDGTPVSPLVWAPRLASPLGEPLKSVGLRFINRTASYRCHASS